jgi:hypothetical protein
MGERRELESSPEAPHHEWLWRQGEAEAPASAVGRRGERRIKSL